MKSPACGTPHTGQVMHNFGEARGSTHHPPNTTASLIGNNPELAYRTCERCLCWPIGRQPMPKIGKDLDVGSRPPLPSTRQLRLDAGRLGGSCDEIEVAALGVGRYRVPCAGGHRLCCRTAAALNRSNPGPVGIEGEVEMTDTLRSEEGEGEMTFPHSEDQGLAKTDSRLRAILSSWHRSPRYRSKAVAHYQSRPVRATTQTELNREFKKPRYTEWPWFLIPLLVLTIIDYFYLLRWG